ncbi:hypothetical protein DFH29DRAFT_813350, partial [Suillus ampliporus]
PFYGHEQALWMCARFITHLFACPECTPSSSNSQVKLPRGCALGYYPPLHLSRVHPIVIQLPSQVASLGSSGHCLFLSAFMLASKVICDDTYSNKSWSIVAQAMLREFQSLPHLTSSYM